ncbi:MAG: hypothetical protein AAGA46_14100 [Cyanobacteria bacterium P01_F01_bin.13]
MSPEQIQGLKLVFAIASTVTLMGPSIYWVLTLSTWETRPAHHTSSKEHPLTQRA